MKRTVFFNHACHANRCLIPIEIFNDKLVVSYAQEEVEDRTVLLVPITRTRVFPMARMSSSAKLTIPCCLLTTSTQVINTFSNKILVVVFSGAYV